MPGSPIAHLTNRIAVSNLFAAGAYTHPGVLAAAPGAGGEFHRALCTGMAKGRQKFLRHHVKNGTSFMWGTRRGGNKKDKPPKAPKALTGADRRRGRDDAKASRGNPFWLTSAKRQIINLSQIGRRRMTRPVWLLKDYFPTTIIISTVYYQYSTLFIHRVCLQSTSVKDCHSPPPY